MKRVLVFALLVAIGNVPTAFAGEGLLASGARHVQEIAASAPAVAPGSGSIPGAKAVVVTAQTPTPTLQAQTQAGTISKSGMGKGKKTLLFIGLAAGFAASVWTIDHHVLDVTPSSLGTRQD
jgi:hypothetical protein